METKQPYYTPQLTVHGTVGDITEKRRRRRRRGGGGGGGGGGGFPT